jgi:hypothetical protein
MSYGNKFMRRLQPIILRIQYEMDYHQVVTLFLQGVISTAIDLAELHSPGVSPMALLHESGF